MNKVIASAIAVSSVLLGGLLVAPATGAEVETTLQNTASQNQYLVKALKVNWGNNIGSFSLGLQGIKDLKISSNNASDIEFFANADFENEPAGQYVGVDVDTLRTTAKRASFNLTPMAGLFIEFYSAKHDKLGTAQIPGVMGLGHATFGNLEFP